GEKRMVQKRTFYEWSSRVPLLIRLPGAERAGTRVAAPVSLVDLLPTLRDLIGVPDSERTPMESESFAGLLLGEDADPDRAAFSEYHLEKVWAPCFMVRRGRFKYIHIHGHGSQLFDLEADPGE